MEDRPVEWMAPEAKLGNEGPRWLRIIYCAEFLLALVAVFTVWSQVGGQMHLDLMPWYWKVSLSIGFCISFVAATRACASQEHPWNTQTIAWLITALAAALAMAAVTYYYHLYEPVDEEGLESQTAHVAAASPLRHRNQIV